MRLEHIPEEKVIETAEFQFHIGAIRTLSRGRDCVNGILFQFHKGAIRTSSLSFLPASKRTFQFHKGAIRTWYASNDADYLVISIP